MVIRGKENLTSYQTTPTVIRYFCKTCSNRVYGVKLDDEGNEQQYVRLHAIIIVPVYCESGCIDVLSCAHGHYSDATLVAHVQVLPVGIFGRKPGSLEELAPKADIFYKFRRGSSVLISANRLEGPCNPVRCLTPNLPVRTGPLTCMTTSQNGAQSL